MKPVMTSGTLAGVVVVLVPLVAVSKGMSQSWFQPATCNLGTVRLDEAPRFIWVAVAVAVAREAAGSYMCLNTLTDYGNKPPDTRNQSFFLTSLLPARYASIPNC
ncbi:hypothetical protein DFP73DRAFT_537825 [Morchella snyderi]|nr:hypothetical protein DFP73DRAFT_537825 [Morchella snyderi]